MGSVILGKMALYWCHECNLPVLGKKCSRCGSPAVSVKYTPPGDIRPAFENDLRRIKEIVDAQFGMGCGECLIPNENVVILNRVPDRDRMEEVIVSGLVVGNLRYDVGVGYKFILKPEGALRIIPCLKKSWVIVDSEAAEYIRKGKSVLAPGVKDADGNISPGDEVVVITEARELIGSGSAKLSGIEMKQLKRGLCVRLRHKWRKGVSLPKNYQKGSSWDNAVKASEASLQSYEKEAVEFVKRTVKEHEKLPIMVSLSGGKDSLAVLLIVLEAKIKPDLLFLNTGLEFPETVENVYITAKKYGLRLITADAADAFYKALKHFGPPARDYRWCCKVCKLGPTTRKIMEEFPGGVLSFIGQRVYESAQRAKKPRVWKNPWVPGQIGASPIQHWTALHIWLYLFSKNAEYNPLYTMGLSRIGCWLCPASDQADYEEILKRHPDGRKWDRFLRDYAREKGLNDEWVDYGLWKWKNPPGFVKELIREKSISFVSHEGKKAVVRGEQYFDDFLGFRKDKIHPYGNRKFAMRIIFNRPPNLERVSKLLNIMGVVEYHSEIGVCTLKEKGSNKRDVAELTLDVRGNLSAISSSNKGAERALNTAVDIIIRGEECVGCGICTARCPSGALYLNEENKVDIHPELCRHCRFCLGKCPVVDFRGERELVEW